MTPNGSAPLPRRKKILFSLIVFVAAIALVELTCRVGIEGHVVRTVEMPKEASGVRADDRVGFVLVPGDRDGSHINRLGLRGEEVEVSKKPGCRRVLMLGGSTTYGNSVTTEQAYPAVVQRKLRSASSSACDEVINAGISGAHSYHHRVRYQHIYAPLKPDIVTIYVGWNDFGTFLWEQDDWRPDSLSAESLVIDVGAFQETMLRASSLWRVGYTAYKRSVFRSRLSALGSSSNVAEQLSRPSQALRDNLRFIIELARKDGATVLLIKFPFVLRDDRVKQELKQLESMDVPGRIEEMLPMVAMEPSFTTLVAEVYDELAKEDGVDTVDCRKAFHALGLEKRLALFDDPIHPNAAGYALIGDCVAEALR